MFADKINSLDLNDGTGRTIEERLDAAFTPDVSFTYGPNITVRPTDVNTYNVLNKHGVPEYGDFVSVLSVTEERFSEIAELLMKAGCCVEAIFTEEV